MNYPNIPLMHRDIAARLGSRPALRFRRDGLFHDVSWNEYRRAADRAAVGLIELGVQPGDRIGILAENRWEWLAADIGILSVGAVDVPLHAPLSPQQVEYQLQHSGACGVIVSDQAQADKVLAVLDSLPDLRFMISFDPVDVRGRVEHITWDGLLHKAGPYRPGLAEIRQREAALTRDSLATIIYTSGTTGNPKGVMLSHGNLVSNAEGVGAVMPRKSDEILLSWLPYSHIYARLVDHYLSILTATTVCLAESIDKLVDYLRELQPTWITSVPRFYEKVWSSVEHLTGDDLRRELHGIFGPRMRMLTSGGAPLPRHVWEGFTSAGLPIFEGYGLTETSPVISFSYEGSSRVGSVGKAIPDVEVKIAEDGEILTRGPHVMQGYWRNPEATAEVMSDGWFHTGDIGKLDDEGFLYITDRKKDLIITSGGKNIAPSILERLLTADLYIDQAVVYGDRKPFATALLVPNFGNLEAKAKELGCSLEMADGFIVSPLLLEFLAERVSLVMQAVSQPERVRRFLLLGRAFQVAADELTASMKIRRRFIIGKYQSQLDALYDKN